MDVIEKQGLMVVGIQVSVSQDYLFTELPHIWNIFFERYKEIANRVDTKFMNICLSKKEKINTYLVCVEVNEFENIPEGMTALDFPAYEYIHKIHHGKVSSIDDSFDKMSKWATEKGYSTSDFKIDYGYYKDEKDPIEHTLLLRII